MSAEQRRDRLLASSPAMRDDASALSGDGVRASRTDSGDRVPSRQDRDARTPYALRPEGLLPQPLPDGVAICLHCMWCDTTADELAAARHTRTTAHPTLYHPPDGAASGDRR